MLIVGLKPGHDSAVAAVMDGRLLCSIECEKDSFPRNSRMHASALLAAFEECLDIPDVISLGGWRMGVNLDDRMFGSGYFGIAESAIITAQTQFLGKSVTLFSSSHERSHIMASYGMSPFPNREPCYALVWEGNIGSIYFVDENIDVHLLRHVLEDPGDKYSFIFGLADPTFPRGLGHFRFEDAGKLMALTSFSSRSPMTEDEERLTRFVLSRERIAFTTDKQDLTWCPLLDVGVQSDEFKEYAGKCSDRLFGTFYEAALEVVDRKSNLPLIIGGGCALNCEWNTRWRQSDLFSAVFVPPCPNDSGSAIGTAVDAQRHFTGNAKIDWSVYAGKDFIKDVDPEPEYRWADLDIEHIEHIARRLADDAVLAWVEGKYEIGPRALGHRSILASPLKQSMHARLNAIKKRERYRPIAALCMEEQVSRYWDWEGPSKYMLYFQKARSDELPAVTHVDGTCRVQTVSQQSNPLLYELLHQFEKITGVGVLCNTSLNYKGAGFINRLSDLKTYCEHQSLDGFVLNGQLFTPQ